MEKLHDIFLSYSRQDRERIRPMVEQLQKEGLTVWWDENIPPGTTWPKFLRENLDASRIVVVAWSVTSVHSDFVIDEAGVGKKAGRLIPFFIDEVDPPLGFGSVQSAKLINWDGRPNEEWKKFLTAIREKLGQPRSETKRKIKQSEQAWKKAREANTAEAYYNFMEKNWHSPHAREALQKIKALEKQGKSNLQKPAPGLGQAGSPLFRQGPPQLAVDYWSKRLQDIRKYQVPAATGGVAPMTAGSDFVFYRSASFWIALILFPALGLGGAWVADLALDWLTPRLLSVYVTEFFSSGLYLAGLTWGVIYLIHGVIEATDYDAAEEIFFALWLPYEALFEDGNLAGLLTALPFNLLLAWGLTFTGFHLTVGISSTAVIVFCVLSLIQVIMYFNLD